MKQETLYAVVDKETGDFASMSVVDNKKIIFAPSIFGNMKSAKERLSWIHKDNRIFYKIIKIKVSEDNKK